MSSVLFTWNLFLQVDFANTILLFPHMDNLMILALEGKIHKDRRFCYCYIPWCFGKAWHIGTIIIFPHFVEPFLVHINLL